MAEAVETLAGSKQPPQRDVEAERAAADRISMATQWQLMWWRFRKHRGAMVAAVVIIIFYTIVLFADFFAYLATGTVRRAIVAVAAATDPLL